MMISKLTMKNTFEEYIDIVQYPERITLPLDGMAEITIGDLHGNTIDLLHNPLKVRNYKYPQSN